MYFFQKPLNYTISLSTLWMMDSLLRSQIEAKERYCFSQLLLKILSISVLVLSAGLKTAYSDQNMYYANGYPIYPTPNYNSGFPPQLIKQGEYLAKAGDCIACHTDTHHHGIPFAGGYAIKTPFGVIYSPNITPDKTTGIGNWTSDQFIKAMHDGIAPNGSNYFPVFPYTSFTKVNVADLMAIQAYLMSLPPINNIPPANDITWPFSIRFFQWGWKLLFFDKYKGVYQYDANQLPEWNRGAYLVQGLAHCGECHSPRNLLGAVKHKNEFTGAFVLGYYAPDITAKGLKDASIDDVLNVFLKNQTLNGTGQVQGPMAEVNYDSLRYMTQDDLRNIVIYLKTVVSMEPQQNIFAAQINISPGITPISHDIYELHMTVFWICVAIGIIVFSVMIYSLIRHRKSIGHKAANFHEHTGLEITWAIIPFIILIIIAVPATKVLMTMHNYAEQITSAQTSSGQISATQTTSAQKPPVAKSFTKDELMKQGEAAYNTYCAACHKSDGTGMPPAFPAIKGSKIATGPIAVHINIVLNGKPGTAMQAFGSQLNDTDLAAIITYQRNAWGNNTGDVIQPSQIAAARNNK